MLLLACHYEGISLQGNDMQLQLAQQITITEQPNLLAVRLHVAEVFEWSQLSDFVSSC